MVAPAGSSPNKRIEVEIDRRAQNKQKGMDRIPLDILHVIFRVYLENRDRARAFPTCRIFRGCEAALLSSGHGVVPANCRNIPIPALRLLCFDYHPESQRLMTGEWGSISVWNRQGAKENQFANEDMEKLLSVHFLKNGAYSATVKNGGTRVWRSNPGEVRYEGTGKFSVAAYNPRVDSLLFGAENGGVYLMRGTGEPQTCTYSSYQGEKGPLTWVCDGYPKVDCLVSHSRLQNCLQVWNRDTGKLIARHDAAFAGYDASDKLVFWVKTNRVHFMDNSGIKNIDPPSVQSKCIALHYDSTKKWMMASYQYAEQVKESAPGILGWMGRKETREIQRNQLVVWDINNTKNPLHVLPSMPLDISKIDFDPKSETLLLNTPKSIQLWDLRSCRQIRELGGPYADFRWDRSNRLILLSSRDQQGALSLSLLDYSPLPGSKQESKSSSNGS